MNEKLKWSAADEQALAELLERKDQFIRSTKSAVAEAVDRFFYRSMGPGDLADALIEHADSVRDALAPYDSGVRPAKVEE
jgi:hypothetical protein